MALTSTVYKFDIELSDVDRGCYEQLSLSLARHPSESMSYLLARTFAYCLEYVPQLEFSRGLSESDEPAIWRHDDTGALKAWIEVGCPTPERLHRARKACEYVAVYNHRDLKPFLEACRKSSIYKSADITVYVLPASVMSELENVIERRTTVSISRSEGMLYVDCKTRSLSGAVEMYSLSPDGRIEE